MASARISDEEALAVDSAVARVLDRCPDQGEVLVRYYLGQASVSAIGRKMRLDRREVSRLLSCAETAVEWILYPGG